MDMELLDIQLHGRRFTWSRPNGQARSRLDRFLVSESWLERWPNCSQLVLDRDVSDHCPILMRRVQGLSAGHVLKEKLKRLKSELKRWNSEVFGDLRLKRAETVQKINELDRKEEEGGLSTEELGWIKEGDQNSRFFHSTINWRRKANSIVGLVIDGCWEEDSAKVKVEVKRFFEDKFSSRQMSRPTLDGVSFRALDSADNALLTARFEKDEVLHDFWRSGVWPKGCNTSFIALVPKIECPQQLNDFRPISLIGCVYKVISNVLANRIRLVLGKIIDEHQFAFLVGRNMLDSVVIASEIIHEAKNLKKATMVFKVDYEKAYDSVEWDFLTYMMAKMNFSPKWVKWVTSCLDSAMVSFLLNGSPTSEFKMGKGLRQG
ncbi:uncharacterized protein LOC130744130 [Lotus japonicus]|uniref:uncharacterized protein LOC130744130 n=1 Tax=Lotus japonicus TaxID=34305 RepID=UPI00258D5855|nr:uncharacterized protein LOC130744130 [Lotus japonicus]